MSSTKVTIVLSVLLFGFAIAHDPYSSRSYHFSGKKAIYAWGFENSTLHYLICNEAKNQSEQICDVVRDTNVVEGTSRSLACQVTLKTENPKRSIGSNMKVVPFGTNRTILVWTENDNEDSQTNETLLRYTTVNFAKQCEVIESKVSFAVEKDSVDPKWYLEKMYIAKFYDHSFTVAFANNSLCGEKGLCKFYVQPELGKVGKVYQWFTPKTDRSDYEREPNPKNIVTNIIPEDPMSPDGEFLVVEDDDPDAYLVENGGMVNRYAFLGADSEGPWKVAYSTSNFLVGLCYYLNSSFNCIQNHQVGYLVLEFRPEFNYTVKQVAMYNLRDAGFLLLTSSCQSNCISNDDHYYVTMFKGTKYSPKRSSDVLQLPGFHREAEDNHMKFQFFEREPDNYCISIARYNTSTNSQSADMLLYTKCFDDTFFKEWQAIASTATVF